MTHTPTPHGDDRDTLIPHEDRAEVLETPLAVLRASRLTPQRVMFVRNSNPYPPGTDTLNPMPLTGALHVTGLVTSPLTVPLEHLPTFPYVQIESVSQCAGNGRAFYANASGIDGCRWEKGAVANTLWGGARLRDVLRSTRVLPGARFLTATGADGTDPYEKSVPLPDALEHAILAYTLNDEPLSGVHGGPVRLIMPGYYATVNVKWLRRLTLTEHETTHEAQQQRYRVPDGRGGTRPCWRQAVKSIIWSPEAGEQRASGVIDVTGAAWTDGSTHVHRVDVSVDGGVTWTRADLEACASTFAWRRWRARVMVVPGECVLMSRAIDASGRAQPLDGDDSINPDGYEWNGVDRVTVTIDHEA